MRSSLICLICSLFFALPTRASTMICGEVKQGEILRGHTDTAQSLSLGDRTFAVDSDGDFLLVTERDASTPTELSIRNADGSAEVYTLSVQKTKWDIQKITGVEQRKVTPGKQEESEILREQKDVRKALNTLDTGRQDWKKGFILPVKGKISGHFGNQRIFNGVPKSPHTGTDIAAAEGTPVRASADGVVLLSGGAYFYGGNMVVLDHGMGLQTIYMHLKEASVKVGQEVKQGDVIGLVGHTGRATGPHLHWGASLNNVRFRPHGLSDMPRQTCRYAEHLGGE